MRPAIVQIFKHLDLHACIEGTVDRCIFRCLCPHIHTGRRLHGRGSIAAGRSFARITISGRRTAGVLTVLLGLYIGCKIRILLHRCVKKTIDILYQCLNIRIRLHLQHIILQLLTAVCIAEDKLAIRICEHIQLFEPRRRRLNARNLRIAVRIDNVSTVCQSLLRINHNIIIGFD